MSGDGPILVPSNSNETLNETAHVKVTPLPKLKVFVLAIILFLLSFLNTILLPFMAFMVLDFGYGEYEVGKYASYMLSAFMAGQLVFSIVTGFISDRIGRRPVMVISMFLTSICCIAFGFSSSYIMALTLRFVTGSACSIIGVAKTYLAEITDETNQGAGYSVFGMCRAIGLIVGPIIGGFLANPADKYPDVFPRDGLFGIYPYALPCVIAAGFCVFGGVMGYFVLEETLVVKTHSFEDVEENTETTPLLGPRDETTCVPGNMFKVLTDRAVWGSMLMYGVIQFYHSVLDDCFVLWARLDKKLGGIGWQTDQAGAAFSVGGITLLVYQALVYPAFERRTGPLFSFRFGVILLIPVLILMPRSVFFLGDEKDALEFNSRTAAVWIALFACQAFRSIASLHAYTSSYILISNSSFPSTLGFVNGFAQSLGSFAQIIGPVIGGIVFSESIKPSAYGATLIFDICIGMAIFAFSSSYIPPATINHRKVHSS